MAFKESHQHSHPPEEDAMKPTHALLATLLLTTLTACDDDTKAACQTAEDCTSGEICTAGSCVIQSSEPDQDMDLTDQAVELDQAPDQSVEPDMAPDMELVNMAPTVSMVRITPDPIPAAGAALRCEYTFVDPEGDQDASTVEWLVNGLVAGMGQDFSDYAAAQQVRCRVTPKDARGAQGMPVDSAARIFGAPLTQITAGYDHTCAIRDGAATCWGAGADGKLGAGSDASVSAPQQVTGLTSDVSAISAGIDHTCAIHDGAAKCWGKNNVGQLGDGTTTNRSVPTLVTGLGSGVSAISAGPTHTCAIQDGAAKCWGNNDAGQLGDDSGADSPIPVQVMGLDSGVSAISAGSFYTCAIHDGAAKCWGSNFESQLGEGSDSFSIKLPTQVTGLTSGVSAISAGSEHTCAIHNGAAKCWGAAGKIGDGGSSRARTPAQVTGLTSGVTAISPKNAHTCAIHDGAAKCWGSNASGQLGSATTDAATPAQVTDLLQGCTQISAGQFHTCAVHMGLVKCWGSGGEGQLGIGVVAKQSTPAAVTFP
jgi:alpha-tubulin suppressor-like RCC1 family protein